MREILSERLQQWKDGKEEHFGYEDVLKIEKSKRMAKKGVQMYSNNKEADENSKSKENN